MRFLKNVLQDKIKYYLFYIFYGLQNLFTYLPIVWNDRNWDDSYILILLRFKLQRVLLHLKKFSNHEDSHKDIKYVNFCIGCLNRLLQNDYMSSFSKILVEKYGDYISTEGKNNEVFLTRQKIITEEREHEYNIEFIDYCNNSYYAEERDRRMLFNVLTNHIKEWWY